MDIAELKRFADHFEKMTCIISVERFSDGSYGNIRIVTGNDAYINAPKTYEKIGRKDLVSASFVPDQPYERYIPKDLNFEHYCQSSAFGKEVLHTYVRPERYDFWIHLTLLPLESDCENVGYCLFTQEFSRKADSTIMASLSPATANRVLKTCINLRETDNFDLAAEKVIKDIGELTLAEHCCILLTDFAQRKCSVLCESLSENTKLLPMGNYVNDDFIDITATWDDTIAGSTCLIVNTGSEWAELKKRNPVWYESMHNAGAKNLVLFPLRSNGESIGYIWAINYDASNTTQIMETLELTTFFIASEIANHQLVKRLEMMSTIDMLTGVFNRNAMNSRIEELLSNDKPDEPVGIVFADLNGFKQINDEKGHFVGDLLLKGAAVTLQNCFPGYEVYRAGGDEFMVFCVGITDSEMAECLKKLDSLIESTGEVSMAVGTCIDRCSQLRSSMRTADTLMYEDKARFYKEHPDQKR